MQQCIYICHSRWTMYEMLGFKYMIILPRPVITDRHHLQYSNNIEFYAFFTEPKHTWNCITRDPQFVSQLRGNKSRKPIKFIFHIVNWFTIR